MALSFLSALHEATKNVTGSCLEGEEAPEELIHSGASLEKKIQTRNWDREVLRLIPFRGDLKKCWSLKAGKG